MTPLERRNRPAMQHERRLFWEHVLVRALPVVAFVALVLGGLVV